MRTERGFSLVETLVAALILVTSVLATLAVLDAQAAAGRRQALVSSLTVAAANLLEEIRSRRFEDAVAPQFGAEADEDDQDKTSFDDVDDYCGWNEEPPQDVTGERVDALDGVRLSVRLWNGDDADQDGQSDTNATSDDDDGAIELAFPAPPGDTCADPGPASRFKVIEVTAIAATARNPPPPVVLRTVRFQ
jgi:type II secretory pathway pseudopilin PulG